VPIYEYRCPNGHLFEVFKRMTDPPPEACEVCGASPVQIVLHPVPVHFKGSGFYSTDYGRGSRKAGRDEGSSSSSDGAGTSESTGESKPSEKKAAEA
jgi:putative FmdB family regulatory protein